MKYTVNRKNGLCAGKGDKMSQFVKQIKRRTTETLQYLAIMAGGFLVGVAIVSAVALYFGDGKEEGIFQLGVILALVITVFLQGFGTIFSFLGEFNLAISMGQTRKSFVWAYEAVSVIQIVVMAAVAFLMGFVENGIYRVILPKAYMEVDIVANVFRLRYLIPGIFAIAVIEMFLQALLLRYGRRAFWGVWVAWMLLWMLPGYLSKNRRLAAGVLEMTDRFAKMGSAAGTAVLMGAGVVFGAVLIGVSWNMLRKQRVTV